MADFRLQIYTQQETVFDGDVTSLVAPGEDGSLGVLARHAPLLTTLGKGRLTVRKGSEMTYYRMSGGFLEVHNNHATVLADELAEVGP